MSGLQNIEVYAIQGFNKCIVNVSFLGPRGSVLFINILLCIQGKSHIDNINALRSPTILKSSQLHAVNE